METAVLAETYWDSAESLLTEKETSRTRELPRFRPRLQLGAGHAHIESVTLRLREAEKQRRQNTFQAARETREYLREIQRLRSVRLS